MEGILEIKLKQVENKVRKAACSLQRLDSTLNNDGKKPRNWCVLCVFYVSSLCDWLLQSLEHWEEVYAVLERETLSLFQDRGAAAQVDFIHF